MAVLLALLCAQLACQPRTAGGAIVQQVATAQQLQAALERGAEHVHVTQHLDLRPLAPAPPPEDCGSTCAPPLFWGPPALQSLTVRACKLSARR